LICGCRQAAAPDFKLRSLNGVPFRLSKFRRSNVALIFGSLTYARQSANYVPGIELALTDLSAWQNAKIKMKWFESVSRKRSLGYSVIRQLAHTFIGVQDRKL
jgi:hypothetical protein